jgi:hypothetical protein
MNAHGFRGSQYRSGKRRLKGCAGKRSGVITEKQMTHVVLPTTEAFPMRSRHIPYCAEKGVQHFVEAIKNQTLNLFQILRAFRRQVMRDITSEPYLLCGFVLAIMSTKLFSEDPKAYPQPLLFRCQSDSIALSVFVVSRRRIRCKASGRFVSLFFRVVVS